MTSSTAELVPRQRNSPEVLYLLDSEGGDSRLRVMKAPLLTRIMLDGWNAMQVASEHSA